MKRLFVLLLAAAALISAAACRNNNNNNEVESAVSAVEDSVPESSADEETRDISDEISVEEPEQTQPESSAETSMISSKEVEKTLKVYDSFSKKYHGTNLWDSIQCYGRFKKNSGDGYYKKGDLVRIIGKYEDKSTVIIYTDSGGVNFEKANIIEFLPKDYTVKESDRLIDTPALPASKVLEDTYVDVYRENYGLPCFSPKEKYADDYGNSLDVVYDKKMIVRYGKILRNLTVYSDDRKIVKKTTVPEGSYVGIMSYSYGVGFGMFGVYNDGESYTIPEYINDNPENLYIEVMPEDFKPPKNSKVYGLDEKTKLRSHATVEQAEKSSDTVIKTVTPISTVYVCFDDNERVMYNMIKGDKLSVISEENDVYTCTYEDVCFMISKNTVKDYTDEKSQTSKEN